VDAKRTTRPPIETLGRATVIVLFLAIGMAAVLIGSSLIEHGHGMLGISEGFSLAILTPVIVAFVLAAVGLLWRATSGEFAAPAPPVGTPLPRQKHELRSDEWFGLLTDARYEFYIAGHSMGLWCSASNRERFTGELRRILAAGGKVTLVMLGAGSPQLGLLHAATGTDYSDRIAQSRLVLGELEGSLDELHRRRLRVTMLSGPAPIPYMVVGNEKRLLTATYLARTDSEAMPCLELGRDSEPGRAIYDDFHKLASEVGGAGA
jgi:hypothetical protein